MNYRLKLKDIHDDKRSLVRAFPKHRKQRTSSDLARFARRLFLRERTLYRIRDRFAHRFHQFRIITARNTVHLDKNRRYQ